MQFDPGFFEREDVAAIGGEFGIIGEMTVIKLLCAVHKAGYYLMWTHRSKMAFMRSVQGLTPELLDRIVERLAEYGFFSRQKTEKGRGVDLGRHPAAAFEAHGAGACAAADRMAISAC